LNRPLRESEVRRLLSRTRNRRRPAAASSTVRSARHLDLNRELEDPRGETVKYFFAALILQGVLYLVCSRIGFGYGSSS
jgi:hypothetical protein